jgi:hypothetical protein
MPAMVVSRFQTSYDSRGRSISCSRSWELAGLATIDEANLAELNKLAPFDSDELFGLVHSLGEETPEQPSGTGPATVSTANLMW